MINDRRYKEMTEHGIVFEPDNKVGEGHLIVAPRIHVPDALSNPVITAQVMRLATMRAKAPCTILFPIGPEARQVQPHMYAMIIPAALAEVSVNRKAEKGESDGPRKQTAKPRRTPRDEVW